MPTMSELGSELLPTEPSHEKTCWMTLMATGDILADYSAKQSPLLTHRNREIINMYCLKELRL